VAVTRPAILLLPQATELEWRIRPRLEEWADVSSYDPPGVGSEPRRDGPPFEVRLGLAAEQLDRAGWDRCVVVADGWSTPIAAHLALARPSAVAALVLTHATVSYRIGGERPDVNQEVWEAFNQLVASDARNFVLYGLGQFTGGSYDEALVDEILERAPASTIQRLMAETIDVGPIDDVLAQLDIPLLFVKHEGCLQWTDEGYANAVAAFPRAKTGSVSQAPPVSEEFADMLRHFCAELDWAKETNRLS
jgi:pimeloyl-ACP methyl ester carboxylesterase